MVRLGNPEYGKIYKLVSFETNTCYVGSTTERLLSSRFAKHKYDYNKWLSDSAIYRTSYELVKYDDCDIILLENYPCKSKEELEARERYWLENTDNCVNKQIPTRTQKEHYEDNKEHFKAYKHEWYLNHKDTHNAKGKERLVCECGLEICKAALKSHLRSKRHELKLLHKEDWQTYKTEQQQQYKQNYNAEWYLKHRSALLAKKAEKVKCECGCEVRRLYMDKHRQTEKHNNKLLKEK